MNKLEEVGKQIKALNERTEILQQVYDELAAEKDKPEYPDGTPGWFWDGSEKQRYFGWLINNNLPTTWPFCRTGDNNIRYDSHKYFEPLTEVILPMPIEYNGGIYLGNKNDHLLVEYIHGRVVSGKARELIWPDRKKVHYWLIKRAEK